MTGEGAQFALCGEVPNLDRVISAARCQQFAVATKGYLSHTFAMTFDGSDFSAGGYVEEQNLASRFDLDILEKVLGVLRFLVFRVLPRVAHHGRHIKI